MKKVIIFLGVIFSLVVFQQCQQNKDIINGDKSDLAFENNTDFVLQNKIKKFFDRNISNSLETRSVASNTSCFDGSGCIFSDTFPITITMPGTCDAVKTHAIVYLCNGVIVIDKFVALTNGCSDYESYLLTLSDYDAATSLDSFEYEASLIYEQVLFEMFNLGGGIASNFYRSSCYVWCANYEGGPGELGGWKIGKVRCGDKCCKRTRVSFIDSNGDLVFKEPVFESIGNQTCTGTTVEEARECRGSLIGPCEHPCGSSGVGN